MDRNNHSELPKIVLDYVDAVIHRMGYRRSVQKDVKAELLSHFEDALRGYAEQTERIQKAEALIRDFGDVKLLGVLIRRGKKRCRPLWQKVILRGLQVTAALFLCCIFYIGMMFTGKPLITTNYIDVLNAQVKPAADDSQNAYYVYQEAVAKLVPFSAVKVSDSNQIASEPACFGTPQRLSGLEVEPRQIITGMIEANQASLDLIAKGNMKPYYWRLYSTGNDSTELLTVLVPNMNEYRLLARMLCWRAWQKAESKDFDGALGDLLGVYDFGRHIRGKNSLLIEQLVAISVEGMACNAMTEMMNRITIPSDVLKQTQQMLSAWVGRESFYINIESEKLFIYDVVQRCFTQNIIGESHFSPVLFFPYMNHDESLVKMTFGVFVESGFTMPSREETLKAVDKVYAFIQTVCTESPASNRDKHTTEEYVKIIQANPMLKEITPALDTAALRGWQNKAVSESAVLMMAIHRFKTDKEIWPESLNVLVKENYIPAIPLDPFSDKPLCYRVDEKGFTLYSVGRNFRDDGGQRMVDRQGRVSRTLWNEEGDAVFWPVLTDSR